MWFTWDSAGNIFFEEDGPKREAARAKCPPLKNQYGTIQRTRSGKPKSSYVECRGLNAEFTQEKHEAGLYDRPTEFCEAKVFTDSFGGDTPKELTTKIAGLVEQDTRICRWITKSGMANCAIHTTMLNGVVSEKGWKPPADYEDSFREYCKTVKGGSGERVALIIGGDGRFWSIKPAKQFNAMRDRLIAIARDEFDIPATDGMRGGKECHLLISGMPYKVTRKPQ